MEWTNDELPAPATFCKSQTMDFCECEMDGRVEHEKQKWAELTEIIVYD